ncbi:MAG: MBL fold metallo-hydrolase [Bacilli bacterium]|nr:MBL fold metallo-hydrolase [Bacilli bacterium]
MQVDKVVVGSLRENCYLIEKEGHLLIVDPGDEAVRIKEQIGNRKVEAILITHHHFDHIGALEELRTFYDVPVYSNDNLEEKEYKIGSFTFTVIDTKGHTDDCITFYFKEEKVMFVGDFLFKGTIGRCDLENSSISDMKKSIEKIKEYPDVIVYPGHGKETTLAEEKQTNPYL